MPSPKCLSHEDFTQLSNRVIRLERLNKYLLIGLGILAIAWAFTSTMGTVQAQAGNNIIQAEGFELVDSQGLVRARLTMLDSGPGPDFDANANGNVRAGQDVIDGGPMLGLYDEGEILRAGLVVYGTEPLLWLSDMDWPGLAYRSMLDGRPMRGFRHNNGRLIWTTP